MGGWRRLALLFILFCAAGLLQACTTAEAPAAYAGLDACCNNNERLPPWLVRIAEPAAPVIGKIIGNIHWRSGYLGNARARDAVLSRLRPMDVIVVSSKGRLSGHTIPGLFQHAAVYVGSEADLKAMGIWSDPVVVPYQSRIRAGARFIEADQKGVHLSLPKIVLDTDRVVVTRPTIATRNWKRRSALRLFGRLGTPFDFNFDSTTPQRLFCAELVCRAIPELRLPRYMVYGRPTIIPDSIAVRVARGSPTLSLVAYVRGTPSGFELRSRSQLAQDIAMHWAGARRNGSRGNGALEAAVGRR